MTSALDLKFLGDIRLSILVKGEHVIQRCICWRRALPIRGAAFDYSPPPRRATRSERENICEALRLVKADVLLLEATCNKLGASHEYQAH